MDISNMCGLIHPGKKIELMLVENNMSQKDLAIRTNVTEKHVSTIISGERDISFAYSKKLEYVFNDVADGYFYDLQLEYDKQKQLEEEKNGITENEKLIYKQLKEPISYILKRGQDFIDEKMDEISKILSLRKFLRISNLELIPATTEKMAFRMQKKSNTIMNQYVMYMWIRICEYYSNKESNEYKIDIKRLINKINTIKILMNEDLNKARHDLQKIFLDCGIIFDVVPNFKGAPAQGFIKELSNGKMLMCITIRGKRVDSFWFTLFHEIAHIINGDVKKELVDMQDATNEKELKADEFASNTIVSQNKYQQFINNGNYSLDAINTFSKTEKIPPFMVIGRMQKDNIIGYDQYTKTIPRYEWEYKREVKNAKKR